MLRQILICILLSPCMFIISQAQSTKSNELYAKGVEAYRTGNYDDAISCFSMVDSIDAADKLAAPRGQNARYWIASALYMKGDKPAARKADRYHYPVPPVDRRITAVIDSMYERIAGLTNTDDITGTIILADSMIAYVENNTEIPLYYIDDVYVHKCNALSASGKNDEAYSMLSGYYDRISQMYPTADEENMEIAAFVLLYSILSDNTDSINKSSRDFFSHVGKPDMLNDSIASTYIDPLSNLLLGRGKFDLARNFYDSYLSCLKPSAGGNIDAYIGATNRILSIYTQAGLSEFATSLIADVEKEINALPKPEKRKVEYYVPFAKSIVCSKSSNYKDAVKYARQALSKLDPADEEAFAQLSSYILAIQSVDGKQDPDLLREIITFKRSVSNPHVAFNINYMLIPVAITLGCSGDAVIMADEIMALGTNKPDHLLTVSIAYLNGQEYVKARKTSHLALGAICEALTYENAKYEAEVDRPLVDVMLSTVDGKIDFSVKISNDTTSYALYQIKQNLLNARLRILEHSDSLATPKFCRMLQEFGSIATMYTHDRVLADSILNEYIGKTRSRFGEASAEYSAIASVRDRLAFEKETYTFYPDRKIYYSDDSYEEKVNEYETKFNEWLSTRNNAAKPADESADRYKPYNLPSFLSTKLTENTDSVFDVFQNAIAYHRKKGDYDAIAVLVPGWMFAAAMTERLNSVMPVIEDIVDSLVVKNQNLLPQVLGAVWLFGNNDAYNLVSNLESLKRYDRDILEITTLLEASSINIWESPYYESRKGVIPQLIDMADSLSLQSDKRNEYFISWIFLLSQLNGTHISFPNSYTEKQRYMSHAKKIIEFIKEDTELLDYREIESLLSLICMTSAADPYTEEQRQIALDAFDLRSYCHERITENPDERYPAYFFMPKLIDDHSYPYSPSTYINEYDIYNGVRLCYLYENKKPPLKFFTSGLNELKSLCRNDEKKYASLADEWASDINYYMSFSNSDPQLCELAYDLAINNKGYLLRSEVEMIKVLREAGNLTVEQKLKEYLDIVDRLDDPRLSDSQKASLQGDASALWESLTYDSNFIDDYTRHMNSSWRQVQAALGDNDMAVEFVRDNINYYHALVLKKGYDSPKIVRSYINSYKEKGDSVYLSSKYSVWRFFFYDDKADVNVHPLDGVENIYFSVAGELNNIAIENMLSDDNQRMCEKYNMYRLSNTRELTDRKKEAPSKGKAVLYGGVNYDLSEEEWNDLAMANGAAGATRSRSLRPGGGERGAVDNSLPYLPGTATEIQDISTMMDSKKISHQSYSGNSATEESFKNLGGSGVTMLHVATHGAYNRLPEGEEADGAHIDNMQRTALFLAGANTWLNGEELPLNVEDGVLTASEISKLDLTDTDLVVLSACETGLGDITGEGVFGLQRGFKKAGANSILMSLWEVDDEATSYFMKEFYRNLLDGQSKQTALDSAKQSVRSQTAKGWDAPHYWAAFILLDAR